jgi:hypothetical protein
MSRVSYLVALPVFQVLTCSWRAFVLFRVWRHVSLLVLGQANYFMSFLLSFALIFRGLIRCSYLWVVLGLLAEYPVLVKRQQVKIAFIRSNNSLNTPSFSVESQLSLILHFVIQENWKDEFCSADYDTLLLWSQTDSLWCDDRASEYQSLPSQYVTGAVNHSIG